MINLTEEQVMILLHNCSLVLCEWGVTEILDSEKETINVLYNNLSEKGKEEVRDYDGGVLRPFIEVI